jgi:hypothetical protein
MSGASPTTKARRARRQWHLRRQIRQSFDEGQNQGGGFHRSVHLQKDDLFWGDFAWYFGRKYVKFVFFFYVPFPVFFTKKKVGLNSIHKKAMVTVHFPNEIVCFAIYERCNRLSDQAVYTCKGVLD